MCLTFILRYTCIMIVNETHLSPAVTGLSFHIHSTFLAEIIHLKLCRKSSMPFSVDKGLCSNYSQSYYVALIQN